MDLSQTQFSFLGTIPVTLTDQGTVPNCPTHHRPVPVQHFTWKRRKGVGGTPTAGMQQSREQTSSLKIPHLAFHVRGDSFGWHLPRGQAARGGSAVDAHTLWLYLPFKSQKKTWGLRDLILLVICNTLDLRFFLTEAAV